LYAASLLVLSVSISLFLLSEQTDVYFAWTIYPPLSAAFLGAGYLSSFLLEFLSAREAVWVRARPAVPGIWVFTFVTMIITLLHLDRFHFDSPSFITQAGTWVWLGVYVSVPIAMGVIWILQVRQPGGDPPLRAPVPISIRALLVVQGVVMLLAGVAMLLLPEIIVPLWPWRLYTLSCQAIGAWGVGIGVLAIQASWENDWWRLGPFAMSYTLYGTLQLINLLRYPESVDWSRFSAGAYTIFMLTILSVGAYGTWRALLHTSKKHSPNG
jgi:hypothetical protein